MEHVMRLELHQLIERFAGVRLHDPERLVRLSRSIRQHGQLMPVVVVGAEAPEPVRWVLIDGYRRVQALREVGEDRVWVDVWQHSLAEALLLCLARGGERGWEAIEQAALLHELCRSYSLRTIAERIGRDVSWVSRRLSLFEALPEQLLETVRAGRVSVWAATRILAPLARANSDHAGRLLEHLQQHPLSTRELECLYRQYQQLNKVQRERLVEHPGLFLQALESAEQAKQAKRLSDGPEGLWHKDLAVVRQILGRLVRQVPALFAHHDRFERKRLQQAFVAIKRPFQRLDEALEQARADDRS